MKRQSTELRAHLESIHEAVIGYAKCNSMRGAANQLGRKHILGLERWGIQSLLPWRWFRKGLTHEGD